MLRISGVLAVLDHEAVLLSNGVALYPAKQLCGFSRKHGSVDDLDVAADRVEVVKHADGSHGG